jgi:hypothetical protein
VGNGSGLKARLTIGTESAPTRNCARLGNPQCDRRGGRTTLRGQPVKGAAGCNARLDPPRVGQARNIAPVTLDALGRFGHIATTFQHRFPLGPGCQGPAARDCRGVLLPAAQDRDRKAIRRLLVKGPPGLGRTREAIEWAIAYKAEQADKDGTRLAVGDFNQAGVPAQTYP